MTTDSNPLSDQAIIEAWVKNASPWTAAVRGGTIDSRRMCTDQAIVDAVLECQPKSVIDLGCGEGWLTRRLSSEGLKLIGIDTVAELIEEAREAGAGEYHVLSYEEIAEGKLDISADLVVCNFSLLGKESVEGLFRSVPGLLNPHGSFIVQTLHPVVAAEEGQYRDGWREGTWVGIADNLAEPAPWYFRTLAGWTGLFQDNGFQLREIRETRYLSGGEPASVIFIATHDGQ